MIIRDEAIDTYKRAHEIRLAGMFEMLVAMNTQS